MSTGLTYVTIVDNDLLAPTAGGTLVFSDYSEAYDYGRWLCGIYTAGALTVALYATGPNQSGYWLGASFTPVD